MLANKTTNKLNNKGSIRNAIELTTLTKVGIGIIAATLVGFIILQTKPVKAKIINAVPTRTALIIYTEDQVNAHKYYRDFQAGSKDTELNIAIQDINAPKLDAELTKNKTNPASPKIPTNIGTDIANANKPKEEKSKPKPSTTKKPSNTTSKPSNTQATTPPKSEPTKEEPYKSKDTDDYDKDKSDQILKDTISNTNKEETDAELDKLIQSYIDSNKIP